MDTCVINNPDAGRAFVRAVDILGKQVDQHTAPFIFTDPVLRDTENRLPSKDMPDPTARPGAIYTAVDTESSRILLAASPRFLEIMKDTIDLRAVSIDDPTDLVRQLAIREQRQWTIPEQRDALISPKGNASGAAGIARAGVNVLMSCAKSEFGNKAFTMLQDQLPRPLTGLTTTNRKSTFDKLKSDKSVLQDAKKHDEGHIILATAQALSVLIKETREFEGFTVTDTVRNQAKILERRLCDELESSFGVVLKVI